MKKKKTSQGKELFVELRGVESVEFWGVSGICGILCRYLCRNWS